MNLLHFNLVSISVFMSQLKSNKFQVNLRVRDVVSGERPVSFIAAGVWDPRWAASAPTGRAFSTRTKSMSHQTLSGAWQLIANMNKSVKLSCFPSFFQRGKKDPEQTCELPVITQPGFGATWLNPTEVKCYLGSQRIDLHLIPLNSFLWTLNFFLSKCQSLNRGLQGPPKMYLRLFSDSENHLPLHALARFYTFSELTPPGTILPLSGASSKGLPGWSFPLLGSCYISPLHPCLVVPNWLPPSAQAPRPADLTDLGE